MLSFCLARPLQLVHTRAWHLLEDVICRDTQSGADVFVRQPLCSLTIVALHCCLRCYCFALRKFLQGRKRSSYTSTHHSPNCFRRGRTDSKSIVHDWRGVRAIGRHQLVFHTRERSNQYIVCLRLQWLASSLAAVASSTISRSCSVVHHGGRAPI